MRCKYTLNAVTATVVERAAGRRSSGSPVDVRGPALPVVREMGITEALRARATRATAMRFVDRGGRLGRRVPIGGNRGDAIEIPRADPAGVLLDAARDHAEFLFDDSIAAMAPDRDGVDVTFDRGGRRRFDLVVGADGLHSNVRRLAFGPEEEFVRPLGLFVATTALGEQPGNPHDVLLYNSPGRLVAVHPGRDHALVAFTFRHATGHATRHATGHATRRAIGHATRRAIGHATIVDFDYRDAGRHREILARAYRDDHGWRVPELLRTAVTTGDLYFDAVSEVVLPSWSNGRVTLLGDSAASVSLLGEGLSLAIAGARTLARAIEAGDLSAYEGEHRRRTDPRRRGAGLAAAMLVPKSRAGIVARNVAARLLPAAR
jgi:2-polyprenyl-6-methoxyphenol hydroxylase-like FAD-dependent oxidoreductase